MGSTTHVVDPAARALEARLRAAVAGRVQVPKQADWKYRCTEDLVLNAGRPYLSAALTGEEQAAVKKVIDLFHDFNFVFEFHHCYYNAQSLMWFGRDAGLCYVEGYVMTAEVEWPTLHGWVAINGKVIDPTVATLEMVERGQKEPDLVMGTFQHCAYWGVAFNGKYVVERSGWPDRKFVGLLDTDWERGWPLHREGMARARAHLNGALRSRPGKR